MKLISLLKNYTILFLRIFFYSINVKCYESKRFLIKSSSSILVNKFDMFELITK